MGGVKNESAMKATDTVAAGKLYVVIPPGFKNANGRVVVAPSNSTVAGLLTLLGLDPATVVMNCSITARATGAFVGPVDTGRDIFEV
jgi:hypothetical protein